MQRPTTVEKSFKAFNLDGVIYKMALDNSSLWFISSLRSGTASIKPLTFVA